MVKQTKKRGGSVIKGLKREKLSAIILADSFTNEFKPVTLDIPRCLLPIVNIPILDYVFEFLATSGVDEIFVFCCANAKRIREFIR